MLLPVLGLSALGLCGLALVGVGTAKVGAVAVLVGAAAALLPVTIVVGAFLWVDRWEPEPARLLLLAFAWGACGATICALGINSTAEVLGDLVLGRGHGDTLAAVYTAPPVEEAAKGLFLIGMLAWRRREFDGLVDGIVYAGVTAAGFAFTENIYYFGRAFAEGGFGGASRGVVAVFILRAVLAPFAHPLFTTMTGIGVGVAARARSRSGRILAVLAGYLGAVLLHSLWNGTATFGNGHTFIDVYFLVMVPIFAGVVTLVVWQRRREQRVLLAQLPGMVRAGWVTADEVARLGSLPARRGWRGSVRREAGDTAARAIAAYQVAATELAFLCHAVQRGTAGPEADVRLRELVRALRAARAAVPDPAPPAGESPDAHP
ncbi:PrsW family intramembrane metalloprotease [Gandjariella thermophila]|uniref:Membrane protein n=1 Tax=Gandjariella thermophila TaxID=1931992 RepID=A0A4D4J8N0_9PSEU|nr:PrsW family intramembrane metalloprotease [Gandjariella thermophila]GDY30779.1 membrane protein [Gandjariella thermophila]